MKKTKISLLVLCLIFGSFAYAYAYAHLATQGLHTEDNELVCQMNDFLETKLFVDRDFILDGEIGKLSSKILEMPTRNARGNNFKLFQVKLVWVARARCPGCEDSQVILYKSDDVDDVLIKLEVTSSSAKVTRNVDINGTPLFPSFVDTGLCQVNEPE